MDKSKEYIKMCDCPEIQEQWEIEIGDDFWDDEEYQIVWYNGMESKEQIEGRIKVYKSESQPKWLPRQDQIQEMMRKDYENTLDMLCDFYGVITVDQPTGFQRMFEVSMEQLWLVFYIYKKHQKKWDGKKWIA